MEKRTENYPQECDGCCMRVTCNHDLEVCCYLVKSRCIVENPNEEEFF